MDYRGRGRGGGFRGGGRSYVPRGGGRGWSNVGSGRGGGRGAGANAKVNHLRTLTGHRQTINCLACSQKRQQLFSGSSDGSVRIWGWPEGNFQQQGALEVGQPVNSLMVEDDWLVAGMGKTGAPNVVRVWNMESNATQDLAGHDGPVYTILQGNGMLFTAGHDAGIRCWKMVRAARRAPRLGRRARSRRRRRAGGRPARPLHAHAGCRLRCGAGSRAEQDPASGQFALVGVLQGHTAPVHDLCVAGTMLYSCSRDNTIKQWDLSTGQGVASVPTQHGDFMIGLTLFDVYLFSAGLDGNVFGAPLRTRTRRALARRAAAAPLHLKRAGARCAAGARSARAVYDTTQGMAVIYTHLVTDRDRKPSAVTSLKVASDAAGNAILVVACSDNAIKLWEVCPPALSLTPARARTSPPARW